MSEVLVKVNKVGKYQCVVRFRLDLLNGGIDQRGQSSRFRTGCDASVGKDVRYLSYRCNRHSLLRHDIKQGRIVWLKGVIPAVSCSCEVSSI